MPRSDYRQPWLKPKDLVGQPWLLAFALRADGWFLRDEIIWHKRNPMPENVRDRFTKAHEKVFLLSKRQTYYFDRSHIQEPISGGAHARGPGNVKPIKGAGDGSQEDHHRTRGGLHKYAERLREGKKVPSGWDTGPGNHSGKIGRYPGVNPKAALATNDGAGAYAEGKSERSGRGPGWRNKQNPSFSAVVVHPVLTRNRRNVISITTEPFKGAHFATFPPKLIEPFVLVGCPHGGTVLDIFGGSGTTGLVADRHLRHSILIELDPSAAVLAKHRIERESPLLSDVSVTRIETPCPS